MKQKLFLGLVAIAASLQLAACGGGGGSKPVLYYPYETVFGDACTGELEPVPGCTFRRIDGTRVTVSEDGDFNRSGRGSDDLQVVEFQDEFGRTYGYIYDIDSRGRKVFVDRVNVTQFQGHQIGSEVGVGLTGLFWVDVSNPGNNQFWFGSSGVLYDANRFSPTLGQAINNSGSQLTDTNSMAARHEMRSTAIDQAATSLQAKLDFLDRGTAMSTARALDQIATAHVTSRGALSLRQQDQQFTKFFGVDSSAARYAVLQAYVTKDTAVAEPAFNQAHRHFGFSKRVQTARYLRALFSSADAELSASEIDLDEVLASAEF